MIWIDSSWKCSCGKHSMPEVQVIVEKGALGKVAEVAEKLALGKRCAVVADGNTRKVAALAIIDDLNRKGYVVSEVVVERADLASVEKVVGQIRKNEFVVGVGGTSILDITKLAAHKTHARYILVSTGIANSGIISKTSSIYMDGKKESVSVDLADAIIVDLDVISMAPAWMIPAGCGDIVGEATAIKDWQLGKDEVSEPYCDSVAKLEMSTLDYILTKQDAITSRSSEGIRALTDALIVSALGMAIWGSSRPSSGSEHLWSHWLDHYAEENKIMLGRHGEQVGLATLMMAQYHEAHNPNWWKNQEYQAEALHEFLRKVGAPTFTSTIGVSKELATQAFIHSWEYRKERYTILHKRHPSIQDAEDTIAKLTVWA